MRLAVLITAGLIAGCHPDINLEVDASLSSDDVSDIRAAADSWNRLTGEGGRKLHVVPPKQGDRIILRAENPPGIAGLEQERFGVVRIDPDVPRDRFYVVVVHELGHVLEIRHTQTGVMRVDATTAEFTDEVITACKRAGACN